MPNSDSKNGLPKVVMVFAADPWSDWTISGISRHICLELLQRGALEGAVDARQMRLTRRPEPALLRKARRLFHRVADRFAKKRSVMWEREDDPRVSGLLRTLAPGTNVVYAFHSPEVDPSLPLRRFRFMDLSLLDAIKYRSYGFSEMSKEAFDAAYQNQYRTAHAANAILTLSSYAADAIARDFHVDRAKIFPIGSGAAVAFDSEVPINESRYRKGEILFVGRDWSRKGGPLLLDAFRRVRQSVPHAVLTIVGPDVDPAPGVDGVNFVGFLAKDVPADADRLRSLFRGASVFCMPSICETWGLVYCEAVAAGMPVVGFADWAMPDIVVHGRTGLLANERHADALAEHLVTVLQQPDLAMSFAHEGLRYFNQTLKWSDVVDRMLYAVAEDRDGRPEPAWLAGDRLRYRPS